MIRIHFVGDGPRDVDTVPHLVATILGRPEIVVENKPNAHWARLNSPDKGYSRKLYFAILVARDAGVDGLVAVVDRVKAGKRSRLGELDSGRAKDRAKNPPFPAALGEADPHGEAWLLDDPYAVRQALGLDNNILIVSIRKTDSPKESLNQLIQIKDPDATDFNEVLSKVARLVEISRCNHKNDTGFRGFVDEVQSELGHLSAS